MSSQPLPSKNPALTRRPDGSLYVVTGASRTGKTTWVARRVERARRLLVWDSVGEWGQRFGCERVGSVGELSRAIFRRSRIAFEIPCSPENFGAFCRLAWVFVRASHGTVVVEELADVTSPGKAPLYWGELVRKGLRYGPEIYALTQRPSESDKTVMGNASVLHVHQMAREEDAKYMARELRCGVDKVDSLRPFQWLERDRRTGNLSAGELGRVGNLRKTGRQAPKK